MAAGDRKVKIQKTRIFRGNPVRWEAEWELWVENKIGVDVPAGTNGTTQGDYGTPAAWRAMTGLQMENEVNTEVAADVALPPRDSIA